MSKDVKHLEFQLLHNLRQLQVRGEGRGGERDREERGRRRGRGGR